jgi:hypothetical protein
MATQNEETVEKKTDSTLHKERRSFLKKSAYAAPTLIAMGGLLKPTQAKAADDFGPSPSDPGTSEWNG